VRLYELATVIRSKNAGPFTPTIDLLFEKVADTRRVLAAPSFSAKKIAALYRTTTDAVRIHPFERVLAIKVSLPRPCRRVPPAIWMSTAVSSTLRWERQKSAR